MAMNEIEKRYELLGICSQLLTYVLANEAKRRNEHADDCICVPCEDFRRARKSLGLEDK